MALCELREKHPRFIYKSYDVSKKGRDVRVQFQFKLEPDIFFTPEVTLPTDRGVEESSFENFIFHLGLIESISYWKAACPQELLIEAGKLSNQQIAWWHDLFIHGLGEFFFQNKIDFTPKDFLNIKSNPNKPEIPAQKFPSTSGDLILVGGGKDSAVTLELLKKKEGRKGTFILNPTRASIDNAKIAGYSNPLIAGRKIDPKLLKLNDSGYLNGHTPFSAYLAFLGVFVGVLNDYQNVVVSNERSATEGNFKYLGHEVNHQYSKGLRFEKLFRQYQETYLTDDVQYFSFLRPLYDLQISKLFSNYPEQHLSFRSCNVNQQKDSWCGNCAKCTFVYISLFPFVPYDKMMNIFGEDYYNKPRITPFVRELLGLEGTKPFECVGTAEESKLAIALSIHRYKSLGKKIPSLLNSLKKELHINNEDTMSTLDQRINKKWSKQNFLPLEYTNILKEALAKTN